jgi:hypothetical protein
MLPVQSRTGRTRVQDVGHTHMVLTTVWWLPQPPSAMDGGFLTGTTRNPIIHDKFLVMFIENVTTQVTSMLILHSLSQICKWPIRPPIQNQLL